MARGTWFRVEVVVQSCMDRGTGFRVEVIYFRGAGSGVQGFNANA